MIQKGRAEYTRAGSEYALPTRVYCASSKVEFAKMKVLVVTRSAWNLKAIFPFNFTRGDFQSASFGARKGKQSISYSKLNVSLSKMKMAIILTLKTWKESMNWMSTFAIKFTLYYKVHCHVALQFLGQNWLKAKLCTWFRANEFCQVKLSILNDEPQRPKNGIYCSNKFRVKKLNVSLHFHWFQSIFLTLLEFHVNAN